MNFELVVTRALNVARRTSPITYIALRSLIDSCPKGKEEIYLNNLLERSIKTNKSWNYRNYKIFKEKKSSEFEYRDLTIGSPLTLLAEVLLIRYLQHKDIYNNNPNVYSYRIPDYDNSGQNFSFFMHGYKKRNREIEYRLKDSKYAYIFDLKKFYPSIDKEKMYEIFNDKINLTTYSDEIKNQLKFFLESLLKTTEKGIAANPDFGHICADFYLEEFDLKMTEYFKSENYFRYVDDIVIIDEDKEKIEEIQEVIESFLPEGLELNHYKRDKVDYKTWTKISFSDIDKIQEEFIEFLTSLTIFLSLNPKKLGKIKRKFIEENIYMPFEKIYSNSQYNRQLRYYKSILFNRPRYFKYLIDKSDEFLETSLLLKEKLFYILSNIPPLPNSDKKSFERRLLIQKYRFCINKLLIFSSIETLEKILYYIPDEEEFIEIRVLIVSLLNNDITELIKFNGNVILSFCELWKSNLKESPNLTLPEINDKIIDSLLTLVIHNIIPYELIPEEKIDSRILNLFSFAQKTKGVRNNLHFDYVDEVSSLLNHTSYDKIGEFLTTRYSDDESIDLDTLKVGRNSSSLNY